MPSQPSDLPTECTACGNAATLRCTGCIDGVNIKDQVEHTYYCGKDCQTAHWKNHRLDCRTRAARKQLHRAGGLLRECFQVHAELLLADIKSFWGDPEDPLPHGIVPFTPLAMHEMEQVALKGLTCFYLSYEIIAVTDGLSLGVPVTLFEVQVRLVGLPTTGIQDAAELAQDHHANHSMVYRVLLPDCSLYALDLSESAPTRPNAVLPLADFYEKYVDQVVSHDEVGTCVQMFYRGFDLAIARIRDADRKPVTFDLTQMIMVRLHRHREHMKAALKAATSGMHEVNGVKRMMRLAAETHDDARASFVRVFTSELTGLQELANSEGAFKEWVEELLDAWR